MAHEQGSKAAGFTLVELLTAIAVASIGMLIAVPSFTDAISSWKLTTAANETLAIWHAARMEAIRTNHVAFACPSGNPKSETPTCSSSQFAKGWLVFADTDRSLSYSNGDKLLRAMTFPEKTVLASDGDHQIVFYPDGRAWSDVSRGVLQSLDHLIRSRWALETEYGEGNAS